MKGITKRYNKRQSRTNKLRRARDIHQIKGWGESG